MLDVMAVSHGLALQVELEATAAKPPAGAAQADVRSLRQPVLRRAAGPSSR